MKHNKNHPQYTFKVTEKLKKSGKINNLQKYTYNSLSLLFSIPIINNIIDIRLLSKNQYALFANIAYKTHTQLSLLGINKSHKSNRQGQIWGYQQADDIQTNQVQWLGYQQANHVQYNQSQIIGGIALVEDIGGTQEQSIGFEKATNIGYKQRQWLGFQQVSHAGFGQEQGIGIQKTETSNHNQKQFLGIKIS